MTGASAAEMTLANTTNPMVNGVTSASMAGVTGVSSAGLDAVVAPAEAGVS